MSECIFKLDEKIDSLLEYLENCVEVSNLEETDADEFRLKMDKLLYECLYYKSKLGHALLSSLTGKCKSESTLVKYMK